VHAETESSSSTTDTAAKVEVIFVGRMCRSLYQWFLWRVKHKIRQQSSSDS
jgi:hypothetical protein